MNLEKSRRRIPVFLGAVGLVSWWSFAQETPLYKNPDAPVEERVADLMSRMTLEEKVAQLNPTGIMRQEAFDSEGNFLPNETEAGLLRNGAGAFGFGGLRDSDDIVWVAKAINSVQRYMIEQTRLGIPVFIFGEALHGFMARGATSFPQAVALGCTWNPELVEQIFTVVAREARARGFREVLSPVLDLARDPRWGRTEECYSEDPYLAARMALAAVYGLQGRGGGRVDEHHVIVTLKHFAGHGQPEGGRNQAPVNYSEREFRETHLIPFEVAVKEGHALSIMAAYNEWDGVPNHVNRKLLTDILRGEWGFRGYVMSDGGGMDLTWQVHRAAAGPEESGALSIAAGLDYDLGSRGCFRRLADQVRNGEVSQADLDRAAANVLRVKFLGGLFDQPYADPEEVARVTNSPEHRELARKAAYQAMVLLKNSGGTLPLDPGKIRRLAVIGPNAADIHLGGYSPTPMHGVSVLEGLRTYAEGKFEVLYAEGCKLTLNKECHWLVNEKPILSDPQEDQRLIAEAVEAAKQADAVILVLGENELLNREAWSDVHLGDTDTLELVGRQNELVEAITATGKPVVALLINGRPLAVTRIQETVPAILECWYLGQETGHAVADVLFGEAAPSGKLSVTFPRSAGQLPAFYNKKPSNHRYYVLSDSSPLYPFGWGLTYTTFEYSDLKITPGEVTAHGSAEVTVSVTNSGPRSGEEIVQLYIRDVVSLPTRPVMELKDFARVALAPGETRTVRFIVDRSKLEALDMTMKRVVPAGEFEIMVGPNSANVLRATLKVTR